MAVSICLRRFALAMCSGVLGDVQWCAVLVGWAVAGDMVGVGEFLWGVGWSRYEGGTMGGDWAGAQRMNIPMVFDWF